MNTYKRIKLLKNYEFEHETDTIQGRCVNVKG